LQEFNKRNGESSQGLGSQVASVRSRKSAVSQHSQRSGIRSILSSKVSRYSEINENDEWVAIQKFNTLLHFEEQKQAMLRESERKRLIKDELDRQVAAK
jgi:hypothetical protein